jgi:hypothetical protein
MLSKYLNEEELELIKNEGFNEHGLHYSIEELNNISIIDKSIEEISKYVDAITYIKVKQKDIDFFSPQLIDIKEGQKVKISVTGLGNLAYIALYFDDEYIRNQANKIFSQLKLDSVQRATDLRT